MCSLISAGSAMKVAAPASTTLLAQRCTPSVGRHSSSGRPYRTACSAWWRLPLRSSPATTTSTSASPAMTLLRRRKVVAVRGALPGIAGFPGSRAITGPEGILMNRPIRVIGVGQESARIS
jgi:hypothetical protein